jgi:Zn-dependent protease
MQSSFPLGRIAGIPVSANWSLIILLGLLGWQLDQTIYPAADPGLSPGTYLAMGTISAVAFALSILLHEFGHAIEARREGMTIHSITLWLFGGVARFEGFFPSGAAEIRIALTGPAVSLVLGLGLFGVANLTGLPHAAQTVFWWLAMINLILAVFNMLPALPLDGGRTLRGIAWAITGDLRRATNIAMQVSRILAVGVIAVGIVIAVSAGDVVGGIWIAFIGFFILQAAAIEAQINNAPQTIDARRIRDVMHPFTASVTPATPIDTVAAPLAAAAPGTAYPVIADGEVQGLLLREVVLALPAEHRPAARAADLMIRRPDLTVITPDTPLGAAQRAIAHDRWGRALVVDDGILVGIVGAQDLGIRPLSV